MEEWLPSQSEVLGSVFKIDEQATNTPPHTPKKLKKTPHHFLKSHTPFKLAAIYLGKQSSLCFACSRLSGL